MVSVARYGARSAGAQRRCDPTVPYVRGARSDLLLSRVVGALPVMRISGLTGRTSDAGLVIVLWAVSPQARPAKASVRRAHSNSSFVEGLHCISMLWKLVGECDGRREMASFSDGMCLYLALGPALE